MIKKIICTLFHSKFHKVYMASSAFDFVGTEFFTFAHYECSKCGIRGKERYW